MNEEQKMIQDLSDLTCINLMIWRKVMRENAPAASADECIVRRNQGVTIEVSFARTAGYKVKNHNITTNRYHACLEKNEEGQRIGLL